MITDSFDDKSPAKINIKKNENAVPLISEQIIDECFADIPIEIDRAFVKAFVLNGQRIVNEIIPV